MAGGHTSEKRWTNDRGNEGISMDVSGMARGVVGTLLGAEQLYLEMQELFTYVGSTVELLAEQLFKEDIAARVAPDNVASAEEIAKVQDAFDAVTAAHELYEAANNVAVTQENRLAQLRRMS